MTFMSVFAVCERQCKQRYLAKENKENSEGRSMKHFSLGLALFAMVAGVVLTGCPKKPAINKLPASHHFGVDNASNYETTWQFDVYNDGAKGTTLVFNVSADQGWIQVNPTSGQSTGKDNPVTITVTIDRSYAEAKLVPSFATGKITVGSSVGNKCVQVTTAPDYFTQEFDANVDLAGRMITYTPNGSLSYYGATQEEGITDFPTDPAGGLLLDFDAFGDPVKVVPLGGKTIPFYEGDFSSVYVSSLGYVGMGNPGAAPETAGDHFEQAQISLFPLDATEGGDVSLLQDAEKLILTYEDVPTGGVAKQPPATNDIQLELFFNGDIRVSYLNVDPAAVGVVGFSSGAGENGAAPSDYVPTDLSEINTDGAKVAF